MAKKYNLKHGLGGTLLYTKWFNMIERCENPKEMHYRWYGAKGIKVCPQWKGEEGLVNFCKWSLDNGYRKGLTLDRIDGNGDYCPSNCRYITMTENSLNKEGKKNIDLKNKILEVEGRTEIYKTICFKNKEELQAVEEYILQLRQKLSTNKNL